MARTGYYSYLSLLHINHCSGKLTLPQVLKIEWETPIRLVIENSIFYHYLTTYLFDVPLQEEVWNISLALRLVCGYTSRCLSLFLT